MKKDSSTIGNINRIIKHYKTNSLFNNTEENCITLIEEQLKIRKILRGRIE